ncbi:hypothetical protein [Sphaerotilus microaerophilus]|nr:hypothetical protein [Sphaerotilus sp. FB-5]
MTSQNMLRLGSSIRLTRPEIARFTEITGFEPEDVRTTGDLKAYVSRCKAYYWGTSRDTQFLHWLIDREWSNCISQRPLSS